jgi:hypothetical protein
MNLTMSLAFSVVMPCCSVGGGLRGAAAHVLDGNIPPHQARGDDLPQRVQLELVVGGQHELRFLRVEIDRRLRALEVIALRHFLASLVERVVHFLEIDVRRDVERTLRRHAHTW